MDNSLKQELRFLIRSQNNVGTVITISAFPSIIEAIKIEIDSLPKEKRINYEKTPFGYELDAKSYYHIQDIIFYVIN